VAHSPDLTQLDFFAWGFLKSEVYCRNIQDLPDLLNCIMEPFPKITLEMLENVFHNAADQFEICRHCWGICGK
jgi:hypothetical protein